MLQIFHNDFFASLLPLAVQRPGHIGVGIDGKLRRAEECDHGAVIFLRLQRPEAIADLQQIPGRTDQKQFKFAVPHIHLFGIQRQNAADGGGIADGTEDEFILDDPVIHLDPHVGLADLDSSCTLLKRYAMCPKAFFTF